MAYEWPRKNQKENGAILVFKLSDPSIFSRTKSLDFEEDSLKWQKLIRYFRSEQKKLHLSGTDISEKTLRKLDYIFGPLADGGYKKSNPIALRSKVDDKLQYQLCIKTYDFADDFYNDRKNIHKVIFLRDPPRGRSSCRLRKDPQKC